MVSVLPCFLLPPQYEVHQMLVVWTATGNPARPGETLIKLRFIERINRILWMEDVTAPVSPRGQMEQPASVEGLVLPSRADSVVLDKRGNILFAVRNVPRFVNRDVERTVRRIKEPPPCSRGHG